MKKLTHSLGMAIVTIFLLSVISCSKADVGPKKDPTPPVPAPDQPTLSLKARMGTALYAGNDTIDIVSNGQTCIMQGTGQKITNNQLIISDIKGDTTISIVATNTNTAGISKSTTQTLTLHCFSQKRTWVYSYGFTVRLPDMMTDSATANLPEVHWDFGPPDLNLYRFNFDNSVTQKNSDGQQFTTQDGFAFQNNDADFFVNGGGLWHIESITQTTFTIWRYLPDLFHPYQFGYPTKKVVRIFKAN